MSLYIFLSVMTLLQIKHLIFDFFYQPPYQWMNKGTYGHTGGLVHAGQHVLGSIASFMIVGTIFGNFIWFLWVGILISIVEGIIHYHMDWLKMNICKWFNYKPHPNLGCTIPQAEKYFWWLGIDQFVHNMTYIIMSVVLVALI